MKKLFCLLMALIIMLTLSACKFPWQKEEPNEDPKEETQGPSEDQGPTFTPPAGGSGPIEMPILPVK